MGDMTAGIRRCNSQQVYHKCKQGQINQLDPPDQEQADLQVFPVERDGKHNGHNRSRRSHQITIGGNCTEIREYVVCHKKQDSPGNTS